MKNKVQNVQKIWHRRNFLYYIKQLYNSFDRCWLDTTELSVYFELNHELNVHDASEGLFQKIIMFHPAFPKKFRIIIIHGKMGQRLGDRCHSHGTLAGILRHFGGPLAALGRTYTNTHAVSFWLCDFPSHL